MKEAKPFQEGPRWTEMIRKRLEGKLPPEREGEVVEELAQLLADASRDARVDLSTPDEVDRWLGEQIPEWSELVTAAELGTSRNSSRRPPGAVSRHSGSPYLGAPPAWWRGGGRRAFSPVAFVGGLRFTLRRLLRKPGFTAVALLSLGVGIAANAGIYSFARAFDTHTAAFESPQELVNLYLEPGGLLSHPDFEDVRDETAGTFAGVLVSQPAIARVGSEAGAELLVGETVSGNYFEVLGLDMALGRPIEPADDVRQDGHPVVVIGHSYWQRVLGADPSVVGREIELSQRSYTVIGVAPAAYMGNYYGLFHSDFFAPVTMHRALTGVQPIDDPYSHGSFVMARLGAGKSLDDAEASLEALAAHLRETRNAGWDDDEQRFLAVPTQDVLVIPQWDPAIRAIGWLVSVAVGLVLLLACVNLASFLLADALDSRRELTLRLALGAERANLVAGLLSESVLLAVLGGAVSVPLAFALLRLLGDIDLPSPVPVHVDVRLDLSVLLFTALLSTVAGLVLGLVPALRGTRLPPAAVLRAESAGSDQRGKQRLRGLLVGAQVAGSMVMLVGAGLFLTSLQRARALDPGFGHHPAAILKLRLAEKRSPGEKDASLRRLLEALEALPRVEAVGVTSNLQLNGYVTQTLEFSLDEVEPPPGRDLLTSDQARVSPDFFDAIGLQLVRGRPFTDREATEDADVVVVSEAFVERYWPGEPALGKQLRLSERSLDVVGVVRDTKVRALGEAPRTMVYLPFSPEAESFTTLIARTSGESESMLPVLERTAVMTDPDLWILDTTTMREHLGIVQLPARFSASVLSLLAAIAISLAVIGLYGAVSYSVSRRTHEIGIRMSLGARARDVVLLLTAAGLRPVLAGAVVGLIVSAGFGRLARGMLTGVSGAEPLILVACAVVLLATAALAAWLPARRASRVDPLIALRSE